MLRLRLEFHLQLLCVLSGVAGQGVAQPSALSFHHLTTAEGLSQSINSFIYRDAYGFVWISSLDGLNRFDGLGVTVYRPDRSNPAAMLGSNIQSPFFEDEEHNLWFCTYEAINCYRRATDDFSHFRIQTNQGSAETAYRVFYRDRQGRIWAQVNNVAYWFLPPGAGRPLASQRRLGDLAAVKCFPGVNPEGGELTSIYGCHVRFRHGLQQYSVWEDSISLAHTWLDGREGRDSARIYVVFPDGNDRLWLGADDGLLLFDPGSGAVKRHFRTFQGLQIGAVRGITALDANALMITSERGLLLFDKRSLAFVRQFVHEDKNPLSLVSDQLNEIYFDRDGNLWVSRWAGGVDFAQVNKVKFYQIPGKKLALPGEPDVIVGALAADRQGDVWCGSNMAPLRKLRSDGTLELIALPNGMAPRVNQMVALGNRDVLVSTLYEGSYWYAGDRRRFFEIKGTEEIPLRFNDFCQLQNGAVVGVNNRGLFKINLHFDGVALEKINLPEGADGNLLRIHQDRSGQIFLAKDYKTIVVLQPSGSGFVIKKQLETGGGVKAFLEKEDLVWAGGDFGLISIQKTDLRIRPTELSGNTVYALQPGSQNDLWLSTNRGLIRYWPDRSVFRYYSLADGLQDYEFNSNSSLRTPDGRLWFGGIRGINVFHPDSIRDLNILPVVQITGLRVNDQPFASDSNVCEISRLVLPYDSSTVSFEFVALEFSDPERNLLMYRLDYADGRPYDKEWVRCENARGFARYARLAPGHYKFQVKGANSDGVWNPEPRVFYLTITPPFWQTGWFRALVAAFLIGSGYLAVRRYVRDRLRRRDLEIREKNLTIEKQEALTQERNRIAGEMHDDLGGGLTSIRMLSERVQNKIENPDTRTQVDKIARYSQELVQKMGEIIWAMNSNFDTVENLVAYIRRYAVEYLETNQLRAVLREPEVLPEASVSGERRRNIYLAVKESLHNIVKHAGATRVTITFRIDANRLVIEVSDDGRGFDPETLSQFGNGLNNMRRRLLDIGGDLQIANDDGARLTFAAPFEPSNPQP